MVKAKLRCLQGDQTEVTFEGEARIGRSGRNQLVISAPVVSAEHARVWYDGDADEFFILDLGSTNGTEVANRRVTGPELLLPLDVIVLGGEVEVLFHRIGMQAPRAPGPPAAREEPAAPAPPATQVAPAPPGPPPALGGAPPAAPPGTRVLAPGEEPLFPPPKGPETMRAAPWQPPPVDPGGARPPDTIVEKPQAPPPSPGPGTERNEG
jgi:hypothetical protein